MSSTTTRSPAVIGATLAATLLVAGGVAVWATSGPDGSPAASPASAIERTTPVETPADPPPTVAEPPTTVAPAATVPGPTPSTPTTAPRTAARATTPTTVTPKASSPTPVPAAPAAPVTPQFTPGQRINPTSAQVQAAIATLHQRIPLFEPTEPQLRTFADATCASFDQGQTKAQVVDTVRQAVTYIQGASISPADAEFAVRTVVQLRCPGYL